MNEPNWDELISAYIDDALEPREQQLVEDRLASDSLARQTLDAFRAQRQLFQKLPRYRLSSRVSQQVLRTISAELQDDRRPAVASLAAPLNPDPTSRDLSMRHRLRRLNWRPATLFAASLAAIVLVAFLWLRGNQPPGPVVVQHDHGDRANPAGRWNGGEAADAANEPFMEGMDSLAIAREEPSIHAQVGTEGPADRATRLGSPGQAEAPPVAYAGPPASDGQVNMALDANESNALAAGGEGSSRGLGGGGLAGFGGVSGSDLSGLTPAPLNPPPAPGAVMMEPPVMAEQDSAERLVVDQFCLVAIPDTREQQQRLATLLQEWGIEVGLERVEAGEAEALYFEASPAFAEKAFPEIGRLAVVLVVDATAPPQAMQAGQLGQPGLPTIPRELEKRVLAQVHPGRSDASLGAAWPPADEAFRVYSTDNRLLIGGVIERPQQVISVGRVTLRPDQQLLQAGAATPDELSALAFDDWMAAVEQQPERLIVFAPAQYEFGDPKGFLASRAAETGQRQLDHRLRRNSQAPASDQQSAATVPLRYLILFGRDVMARGAEERDRSSAGSQPPPSAMLDDR